MDTPQQNSPGYHLAPIVRGEIGELSKIQEELDELTDATDQNCKIMELLELSDLYGAMEAYLETHHPCTSMSDIATMSALTRRAFQNGARS